MPIKVQYNRTFLHVLTRDLRVREQALPILLAKESALRFEVLRAREEFSALEQEIALDHERLASAPDLWNEFSPGLVAVERIEVGKRTIAGVKTPVLDAIVFIVEPYSIFGSPFWIPEGIEQFKRTLTLAVKKQIALEMVRILEAARKKTTQKVNLYQKVLIPDYIEAIRKIKRFLEDEENLSKSSQKILKSKIAAAAKAAA